MAEDEGVEPSRGCPQSRFKRGAAADRLDPPSSGRWDSNPRSPGPKPGALAIYATSGYRPMRHAPDLVAERAGVEPARGATPRTRFERDAGTHRLAFPWSGLIAGRAPCGRLPAGTGFAHCPRCATIPRRTVGHAVAGFVTMVNRLIAAGPLAAAGCVAVSGLHGLYPDRYPSRQDVPVRSESAVRSPCTPTRVRTEDPPIKSRMLLPTEL